MATADKQIVFSVAPAPTGPAWVSSIPSITFTQGSAGSYDLKQHTVNFNLTANIMALVAGALQSGVTLTAQGVVNYNGSGPIASASGLQFDIQNAPSGFTLVATGRTGQQFFGANDHLGTGEHGDPVGAAVASRTMNLRSIRDIFHWEHMETSPGVYGFRASGGHPWAASMFTEAANHAANSYDMHYQVGAAYPNNPLLYGSDDVPNPSFRQLFVNYVVSMVQQWLAAGNAANRLTICISNESNETTFGDYGYDWNKTTPQIQTYGTLCKEVRTAVRAVNSQVRIQIFDGVNGSHNLYANWHTAIKGTSNFWSQAADIFATHEYNIDPYPTAGTPETLYARARPWAQTLMTEAAANGRPDITTAITETGFSSNTHTDAEIVKKYGRWLFLASVIPGMELFHSYALRSAPALGLDLLNSSNQLIANRAFAVRDCCLHLNLATARRMYDGAGGDVFVAMDVPSVNGGQRIAVWNLVGRTLTGLICNANQAGTLRIQTIAGAVTTTALVAGSNTLPAIALTDTPKVLHTTDGTVISFPGMT